MPLNLLRVPITFVIPFDCSLVGSTVTLPPTCEGFARIPARFYLILWSDWFLTTRAITARTLGTMVTPLPYRSRIRKPATGNPAFSDKQRGDAGRCSVRAVPPCIGGWPGKLTGLCHFLKHSHFPGTHANCHMRPAFDSLLALEFRQCSFHHTPLTLTTLCETISLQAALSNDALFTAPFRALLHYSRWLTLVGTGDVSIPGSLQSAPLARLRGARKNKRPCGAAPAGAPPRRRPRAATAGAGQAPPDRVG